MKKLEECLLLLKEGKISKTREEFDKAWSDGVFVDGGVSKLVDFFGIKTDSSHQKDRIKKALLNLRFSKEEAENIYGQVSKYGKGSFNNIPEEKIKEALATSDSLAEALRKLGKGSGWDQERLNNLIKERGYDVSHMSGQAHNKGKGIVYLGNPNIDIRNSDRRRKLKNQFIQELKRLGRPIKCEYCGRDSYTGGPLTLQVHHGEGGRDDQRFENLHLLCPTCHALTDNYCGKKTDPEDDISVKRSVASTKNYYTKLKLNLLKNGRPYKCEKCGKSDWIYFGKRVMIPLQVHHLYNKNDNTTEHLQLLCPNCHSQTENYAGKSNRKK